MNFIVEIKFLHAIPVNFFTVIHILVKDDYDFLGHDF